MSINKRRYTAECLLRSFNDGSNEKEEEETTSTTTPTIVCLSIATETCRDTLIKVGSISGRPSPPCHADDYDDDDDAADVHSTRTHTRTINTADNKIDGLKIDTCVPGWNQDDDIINNDRNHDDETRTKKRRRKRKTTQKHNDDLIAYMRRHLVGVRAAAAHVLAVIRSIETDPHVTHLRVHAQTIVVYCKDSYWRSTPSSGPAIFAPRGDNTPGLLTFFGSGVFGVVRADHPRSKSR